MGWIKSTELAAVLLCWLVALSSLAQEEAPERLGKPASWAVKEQAQDVAAIDQGTIFYLEPDHAATKLLLLPECALPIVETRDSWAKLRYGDRLGWVDLGQPRGLQAKPTPDLDHLDVIPIEIPVETVSPSPEMLRFGGLWEEENLGRYTLFSRVREPRLILYLGQVVAAHMDLYVDRYGLPVPSNAGGVLVLFAEREQFEKFRQARGHDTYEAELSAYFHSPDQVVMFRGFETRRALGATILHELTHLLNWQILWANHPEAEDTPTWLSEGMAGDLALASDDRKGGFVLETLSRGNLRYGEKIINALARMERETAPGGKAPSLEELLNMSREVFMNAERSNLHYDLAAFWVRYLLEDAEPGLRKGFQNYLKAIAQGGSTEPEVLLRYLGRELPQLQHGFRGWLLKQRLRLKG